MKAVLELIRELWEWIHSKEMWYTPYKSKYIGDKTHDN